jgi:hypothetical protein
VAIVHPRGTIILASQVPDQNGVNPKDRPVLLLIDFEDTHADAYGVAISTAFPHPPPATSIVLPYQRQGNCQTGLTSPSVAVCDWPVIVGKADTIRQLGSCPPLPLAAVLGQLPTIQPRPPIQQTPNASGNAGS